MNEVENLCNVPSTEAAIPTTEWIQLLLEGLCQRRGTTVLPHFVPPSKALWFSFKHIYNKCGHAPLHGGAWSSGVTASLDPSHFLPLNRVLAMSALSWDNKGPHSQNYLSTPDHIWFYWLGVEEKWVGPHLHVVHMHMWAIATGKVRQ